MDEKERKRLEEFHNPTHVVTFLKGVDDKLFIHNLSEELMSHACSMSFKYCLINGHYEFSGRGEAKQAVLYYSDVTTRGKALIDAFGGEAWCSAMSESNEKITLEDMLLKLGIPISTRPGGP